MFSYYGSKSKVVHYYPKPQHRKIIEPFAGSARYSLKYFENDVLLVDKYEVIISIWKYLQKCTPKDILSLPKLRKGDKINRSDFDCIEQAWLMGFLIKQGGITPDLTVSKWGAERLEKSKRNIASQLFKIKHWEIRKDDFKSIKNEHATWFIDPPYQVAGCKYRHSNKHLNFSELSEWCQERNGQVIVCENTTATWMDFKPMVRMNGLRYNTTEAIWTNLPSSYNSIQQQLIFST